MTEKRFKTKQELLKWCRRNFKYSDYVSNEYDYVKKLKEKQGVNCSDREKLE